MYSLFPKSVERKFLFTLSCRAIQESHRTAAVTRPSTKRCMRRSGRLAYVSRQSLIIMTAARTTPPAVFHKIKQKSESNPKETIVQTHNFLTSLCVAIKPK